MYFGTKSTKPDLEAVVSKMAKLHGGIQNYHGTNVVATCGSMDPWRDLVLTKSKHPSVVTFMIQGASHCADHRTPSKHDSESLKNARKIIVENIRKWIA